MAWILEVKEHRLAHQSQSDFWTGGPTDNSLSAFVQARISEFKQFQKISTLAGLFHSVLFREAEVNRIVKIELRAFLAKLHPEELWFLKEIDHYSSDIVLEEDYQRLCAFLKISQIK